MSLNEQSAPEETKVEIGDSVKAEFTQEKTTVTVDWTRFPCWDESDDGVPPCCVSGPNEPPAKWWKVFNHDNPYTNNNIHMARFGNVGLHYYDKYRKFYMGIAMWSTLIGIFFTIAGACALDTGKNTVINTHWLWLKLRNETSGEVSIIYLGLRSMVYKHEPCILNWNNLLGQAVCSEDAFEFADMLSPKEAAGTLAKADIENDFIAYELQDCMNNIDSAYAGFFITCATLLFALLGTINRMKYSSDSAIQKALGMITDLCGFISLTISMIQFRGACQKDISDPFKDTWGNKIETSIWLGPGYYCYLVCLFGACMRALFHWLTPLPKMGAKNVYKGLCDCKLPDAILEHLDEDGDGTVSMAELGSKFKHTLSVKNKKIREEKAVRRPSQGAIVDEPMPKESQL